MKISKIETLEELIKFKIKLDNKQTDINFFQTYDFINSYINFYKNKFEIYIVEDASKFVIFPLSSLRYYGLMVKGFIGTPFISEENDVIHNIKNHNSFNKFIDFFFLNIKANFYFNNIKEGFFKDYMLKNFFILNKFKSNTLKLDSLFNKNNLNKILTNKKKEEYNLRKFKKDYNLEKIKLEDFNLSQDLIKKLNIYDFILDNKNIKIKHYYRKMIQFLIYLTKFKLVKINIIKVKDIILSLVISIRYKEKFYYILPCYNKKFSKYSFGNLHLQNLIKNCKNQNITFFFLGPGQEAYKNSFTTENNFLYNFTNSKRIKLINLMKEFIYRAIT
jgi:hypothetical protein